MTRPDLRIVAQSPWNDPHSYLAEQQLRERIRLREQLSRRQRLVAIFALAVAAWCVVIFGAQLVRGAL